MNKFLSLLKKLTPLLILIIGLNQIIVAQDCSCYDYLYMNDVESNAVHKFQIQADGSLVEILDPSTNDPWLTGINSPHGGGIDENGFFYVGDRTGNFSDWRLFKVNCDGEIIDTDVTGPTTFAATNIIVLDPHIYAIEGNFLTVTEICTGARIATYPFCVTGSGLNEFGGGTQNWGLELGSDGNIYITSPWNILEGPSFYTLEVYQFSTDYTTWPADCSQPPLFTYNSVNQVWGITMDDLGNYYVIERNTTDNNSSTILKFDSSGNLLGSLYDSNTDGTGFGNSAGIDYSPESGYLYVTSFEESCLTIVDPVTMQIVAEGIPPTPGSSAKGLQIINQCCLETTTASTYSVSLCPSDELELPIRDLLPCPSACTDPSLWTVPGDVGFDNCALTVDFSTTTTLPSCLTYNSTTESCNIVSLEICISLENPSTPLLEVVDNDCALATNGSINVITDCGTGSTLEYSVNAGNTWSTTLPTYDPINPMTVIARCVSNSNSACISPESAPVTTNPEDCCAEVPTTPLLEIVDNDCVLANNGSINILTDCGVGSTLEYSINAENTWSTTPPTYNSVPMTVIARCVSNDDPTCISPESAPVSTNPEDCCAANPTTPVLEVVDNDCALNTNGSINIITDCGAGSTMEYSTNAGNTWSTTLPTYDPVNTMAVIARCVSNDDSNCISPESTPVKTNPTNCCCDPQCPTTPVLEVVDNDCALNTNGSINVITDCGAGSTLEYSVNAGYTWSTTIPTYIPAPMTVIARCVSNDDSTCVGPESTQVITSPTNCCCATQCSIISVTVKD